MISTKFHFCLILLGVQIMRIHCKIDVGSPKIDQTLNKSKIVVKTDVEKVSETTPKPNNENQSKHKNQNEITISDLFDDGIGKNFREMEQKIHDNFRKQFSGFSSLGNLVNDDFMVEPYGKIYHQDMKPLNSKSTDNFNNIGSSKGQEEKKLVENKDPTLELFKALGASLNEKAVASPKIKSAQPFDINTVIENLKHSIKLPKQDSFESANPQLQPIFLGQAQDIPGDLGDVAIFELGGDADEEMPKLIPVFETVQITIPINETKGMEDLPFGAFGQDDSQSLFTGLIDDMFHKMKSMMDMIRDVELNRTGEMEKQKSKMKIYNGDTVYEIPQNDFYVNRSHPGFLNITWKSDRSGLNNSLYLNVKKDEEGHVVEIRNAILRLVEDRNEPNEYNMINEPLYLVPPDAYRNVLLNFGNNVGVKFPQYPESFDVVAMGNEEKLSAHWLSFSIALLGLFVAGLIMFLSYVIHSKNTYTRRSSISKIPIA